MFHVSGLGATVKLSATTEATFATFGESIVQLGNREHRGMHNTTGHSPADRIQGFEYKIRDRTLGLGLSNIGNYYQQASLGARGDMSPLSKQIP